MLLAISEWVKQFHFCPGTVKNLLGRSKSLSGLLYANTMCVRTILHYAMGKSSIAKVQYLHTNVTVLTAKYCNTGMQVLVFSKTRFSIVWWKIVRTYMGLAYNNPGNGLLRPNRFLTVPGQKWNCFTHSDIANSIRRICNRHPTDTGYRSLLRYVSRSFNKLPIPWGK